MTGAVDAEILTTENFFQDAFGIGVTHGTRNKLDLPSTYDYNSERYLLYVNGSRATPGTSAFDDHFSDKESSFDLGADSGDTVELRVRERPRYVPGFEILNGIAWYMANSLPANGRIKVGLRDPGENGFYVDYQPDGADAVIVKAGTESVRTEVTDGFLHQRDENFQSLLQQPKINRNLINMYGVGNFKPGISYLAGVDLDSAGLTADQANVQYNDNMLAEHLRANDETVTDDVGVGNLSEVNTEEFNMHLSIEIDLSSAASAATLTVLSMQYVVLGDVEPTTRPKPTTLFDLGGDSIGAGWNDDVLGLRTAPSQVNVDVDLTNLGVTPSGGTVEVVAMAFEPDDLSFTDGNFVPVEEQAGRGGENTVLEANGVDAPFGYPTRSVTNPFGASVTVPDGRLVTRSTETAGGGFFAPPPEGERTETKRTVFNDDIILIIPRGAPGTSGANIDQLDINTEQDW